LSLAKDGTGPLPSPGGWVGGSVRIRVRSTGKIGSETIPAYGTRCFIRAETIFARGVRRISFFPRLFLDSPMQTPYLVCVMIFDHKIRYL
jgi:hypothetical protein